MIAIHIDCQSNDWDDIKYGGPSYLGFDFYVDDNIDQKEYEQWLRKKLKEYGHGCINIKFQKTKLKVWSKEDIEECMKNTKFD